MIAQNKVRKTQKKLLKKADVFMEPLSEIFNEFIDIIAVSFISSKETAIMSINSLNISESGSIKTSAFFRSFFWVFLTLFCAIIYAEYLLLTKPVIMTNNLFSDFIRTKLFFNGRMELAC